MFAQVLTSLIIAFSFLSTSGGVSSLDHTPSQVEKADNKKQLSYNYGDSSAIQIESTDFDNGYLTDFVDSLAVGTYSGNVNLQYISGTYYNGYYDVDFQFTATTFVIDSYIYAFVSSDNTIGAYIDFQNGYIKYRLSGVDYNANYIELPNNPNNATYDSFYNSLYDYIVDNTTITISSNNLNTYAYLDFATKLKYYIDNDFDLTYSLQATLLASSEINYNIYYYSDYGYLYFYNEGHPSIYFYLNGGNCKGVFMYDGKPFNFSSDLEIHLYDFELYENVASCIDNKYKLYSQYNDSFPYYESFVIDKGFNYNKSFGYGLSSPIVKSSYFDNDSDYDVVISTPYFRFGFNGQTYNSIVLHFKNARSISFYYDSDTLYNVGDFDGYGYFSSMDFVNSDDNSTFRVCYRNAVMSGDNVKYYTDTLIYNVDNIKLYFYTPIISNLYEYFEGVSSDTLESSIFPVFVLIDYAFVGLTSLFSIMILPGITIGTLFLTPLVFMLLLFVVKLFKR